MAARKLHAPDATHVLQLWAQALRIVIAIDAKHRRFGEPLHLRMHRRTRRAVHHPTGQMKLEFRALIGREHRDQ
jgi:hypothetical protein